MGHRCAAAARRAVVGRVALHLGGLIAGGCAATSSAPQTQLPQPVEAASDRPRRNFSYVALDGTAVSTATLRGRVSVIVLATTYDDASHAQVLFLRELVRQHVPRIHGVVLVLEPEQNRPMVEAFASALELEMPVVMADEATIEGEGPFPGLHHVPSVVILDREGREAWRRIGLTQRPELEDALAGVEPPLPTLRGRGGRGAAPPTP